MPRHARIDAPGALHHVIVRGIERRAVFRDNADRDDFLRRLGGLLLETATPCFAWALLGNHVHLLVRTGNVPLATLMRRLLTGYAMGFNRRHRRHGKLFQNRYKSILCQQDPYLLELTRYIHLNPLRARIVPDLQSLDQYPYSGHAALMGTRVVPWQDVNSVLGVFASDRATAQHRYRSFVAQGVAAGRRPELVGGGLVRSMGGWKIAGRSFKGEARIKGDERILGDSDFVQQVLADSREHLERKYRLRAKGIGIEQLARCVAGMFGLEPDQVLSAVRYPKVVQARSILCYWAVRELGMTATALAQAMGLTQPAVSMAVKRGEKLVKDKDLNLESVIHQFMN